jgi:hypothetical protein
LTSLRLVSSPHPPYSPDLAPSDFYLFGKVKNLLTGKKFASADDFFTKSAGFWRSLAEMDWMPFLLARKRDYKNASLSTESMWTKRILKMASVL